MYSSSRKRCPKTKWALKLLTAAFLAASPAAKSAVNNAYDALIIEARKGMWGSDQFWADLVQPGRTSKPCVARGVVI